MLARRSLLLAAAMIPTAGVGATETARVALAVQAIRPERPYAYVIAFQRRLAALGYVEGTTLVLDQHFLKSADEPLDALAERVVASRPRVIMSQTATAAVALRRLTSTIPIVLGNSYDPVAMGLAQSLARPGGNVTGLTAQAHDLFAKWIELVRDLLPSARRVLGLGGPVDDLISRRQHQASLDAAARLGMVFVALDFEGRDYIERVRSAIASHRPDALLAYFHPLVLPQTVAVSRLASELRVPWFGPFRTHTERGALASYGATTTALWERAAEFVDRILKGADPATMPIEQPTRFELVINLGAARALGIEIPSTMLALADEVIE